MVLEAIHSRGIIHGDIHPGNLTVIMERGMKVTDVACPFNRLRSCQIGRIASPLKGMYLKFS